MYPPPPRPAAWQRPPAPGVPVVVEASKGTWLRYSSCPMTVEFAPGMVFGMRPGRNQFFLPPGVYRAQMYERYWGMRVGAAELTFDTRSGRPVFISYAAPYTIYSRGAAGFTPQQRPGGRVMAGIMVGAFLLPLALVVAGIVAAAVKG